MVVVFAVAVFMSFCALNAEAQTNLKCKRAKLTFAISRVLNMEKQQKRKKAKGGKCDYKKFQKQQFV